MLVSQSQGKSEVHMSKTCALVTLQLSSTICSIHIIILAYVVDKLQPLICMVILLLKYGKLLTSHISPALAPTYYSEVFPTLQGLHNDITTNSLYSGLYC